MKLTASDVGKKIKLKNDPEPVLLLGVYKGQIWFQQSNGSFSSWEDTGAFEVLEPKKLPSTRIKELYKADWEDKDWKWCFIALLDFLDEQAALKDEK